MGKTEKLREALTESIKSDEIRALMSAEVVVLLGRESEAFRVPDNVNLGEPDLSFRADFGVALKGYGVASIKPMNYFISWKKLVGNAVVLTGRAALGPLSAMSVLWHVIGGAVHVFDSIDAKIIHVIYGNSNLLPLRTEDFYSRVAHEMPEVNAHLFEERIIRLANCDVLSIDGDVLKIVERFYLYGS